MWQVLAGALAGGLLCYAGGRVAPRWLDEPQKRLRRGHLILTVLAGLVLGGLLAARQGLLTGSFLQALVLTAILVTASLVDLFDRIIPNELMLLGLIAWPVLQLIAPAGPVIGLGAPASPWWNAGLGFLFGGGVLCLLALIYPGGMGAGDVKMAAVFGLYLGWPGTAVALFLAFLLGGAISVALLAARVITRKQYIPFGPFLAAGAVLSLLVGEALVRWYWIGG